jgi:hypothetical protein
LPREELRHVEGEVDHPEPPYIPQAREQRQRKDAQHHISGQLQHRARVGQSPAVAPAFKTFLAAAQRKHSSGSMSSRSSLSDGEVIAGVGVGGTTEQDIAIAEAAL